MDSMYIVECKFAERVERKIEILEIEYNGIVKQAVVLENRLQEAACEIYRLREALKIIHSRVTDMPKNITPNLAIAMFSAIRYQTTTALGEKE